MTRLLLVRHGEIQSASPARYWGWTDVPLTERGKAQVQALAAQLANEPLTAIYSSDLCRAVDTATAIAAPHHLAVLRCPELREIDFGRCEGLSYDDIIQTYPHIADIWTALDQDLRFPGGESLGELARRVDQFIARLALCGPQDTVLVVAHGGSLRMLACHLLGWDLSRLWSVSMDIASVTAIDWPTPAHPGSLPNPIFGGSQ